MKRIDEFTEKVEEINDNGGITTERGTLEMLYQIAVSLARICDALEATITEPEEDKEHDERRKEKDNHLGIDGCPQVL